MPRIGGHHVPMPPLALFACEATCATAAALALTSIAVGPSPGATTTTVGCTLAVIGAFYLADLYRLPVAIEDGPKGALLLRSLGRVALAMTPVVFFIEPTRRTIALAALITAGAAAAATRALLPLPGFRRRAFLVGEGPRREALLAELSMQPGEVIVGEASASDPGLADRIHASKPDVVITLDAARPAEDSLLSLRLAGVEVLDAAAYVERSRRKLSVGLVGPATLIFDDGFTPSRLGETTRRLLSLVSACVLLVLLSPVTLLIALAIRIDSPGPILFQQARVGLRGRVFRILKFRTMREDAEKRSGAVWATVGDPRVTRIGRFLRNGRLDEIPQLINVFLGDMDLVGPRPERPELVASLRCIPFFDVRTLVRPGITGWAQICFPYGASLEDTKHKLGYDLYYIKHASPLLDSIVLFHTAKVVLTAKGAR